MARKQKCFHYIYKTTNIVNGKYYIGMHSTDDLNDGYIGSGKKLWYSIKKYGKENFKSEILEFLPNRTLLKNREKEIVNEDILKDKMCLNLKMGGDGGIVNEEHGIKLKEGASKWTKAQWEKESYRNKIIEVLRNNTKESHRLGKIRYDTFTGKSHSEETKQKIGIANSIKQKGESNSQFGTCWITNGTENKKIKKTDTIPEGWILGRN